MTKRLWNLARPGTCALWLLPILAAAAGPAAAQSG